MQIILLERIEKLGQMGDLVNVKTGYARNFLIPQGKALRATKANTERFQAERTQREANNLELRKDAETEAGKMKNLAVSMVRAASEMGQLFGSVTSRDIAECGYRSWFHHRPQSGDHGSVNQDLGSYRGTGPASS